MVLLDTHVLIWLASGKRSLGRAAVAACNAAADSGTLRMSSICVWEVAQLVASGRLVLSAPTRMWVAQAEEQLNIRQVALTGEMGILANELPGFHKDPADRMIAATALHLSATLVTADEAILRWPGPLARLDARA